MGKFQKATKTQAKLRLALIGPSGSGKTYSALAIATGMGGRTAVIDTEHGSASKYAGIFDFDVLELTAFAPAMYVQAIHAAEEEGYDNVVIDSLSHAWMGKGGALEMVDAATRQQKTPNSYTAWGKVTPEQNKMVEAILACRANIFVTMRSKQDYVQEKDGNGRTTIRKVGMAPVQRDGVEYEFDVVGDLTIDNDMVITKTRCPDLVGQAFSKPGKDVADILRGWLGDGAPAPEPKLTDGLPSALRVTEEEASTVREWLDATATDESAFLGAFGTGSKYFPGPKVLKIEDLTPEQYKAAVLAFEAKSQKGATA